MKRLSRPVILFFAALFLTSCFGPGNSAPGFEETKTAPRVAAEMPGQEINEAKGDSRAGEEDVSLDKADKSRSETVAITERKIIRNAELRLEAASPEKVREKITAIAESKNGFVVQSTQRSGTPAASGRRSVEMRIRVPSAKFAESVNEIRKTADRVIVESVTGQDVTEKYIDIEARLKTKKALEAQFIEIMKRSRTVAEALNVQRQLANVRGEIERIEGKKRFLENQSSLSTISVNIQTPTALSGSSGGFFYEFKEAVSDGFDGALYFILILIRVVLAAIPFLLLIVLPILFILRYIWRKYRKTRFAKEFAKTKPIEESRGE